MSVPTRKVPTHSAARVEPSSNPLLTRKTDESHPGPDGINGALGCDPGKYTPAPASSTIGAHTLMTDSFLHTSG